MINGTNRQNIFGMGFDNIVNIMLNFGEKKFRAKQIFNGIYHKRFTDWSQFSNLSFSLRCRLKLSIDFSWPKIFNKVRSHDNSIKYVFILNDHSFIESICIPYEKRMTICLSTQVGCAVGCIFCATGSLGVKRNLYANEIVGQVMAIINDYDHFISNEFINIVFMGMGEPLNNFSQVMLAFSILTDGNGMSISSRRITLSTAGVVSGIDSLSNYDNRPRLAVSFNATTNDCRSWLMPINKIWNIERLIESLNNFSSRMYKKELITIEYVLISSINDSIDDAYRLVAIANKFPSKVNIIPLNKHSQTNFFPSSENIVNQFCFILSSNGIITNVRRSRGADIFGACGQMLRKESINN